MNLAQARELLDVSLHSTVDEVRSAFRVRIRTTHPDVSASQVDATDATRQVLVAYRICLDGCRRDDVPAVPEPTGDGRAWLVDGDTIALACSHEEAFARVLDVGSALGAITYLDRQGDLIEVLLRTKLGDTVSLVVSFQGRADWVEAFLTTEVLDVARHELPTTSQLTELMVFELQRRW